MKPEDQLMDALLKEQARKREADEALLAGIEAALDGETAKKPSKWKRVMPLSIAALLAMTAAGVFMRQKDFAPELAVNEKHENRAMRPETYTIAPSSDEMAPPSPPEEEGIALSSLPEKEQVPQVSEIWTREEKGVSIDANPATSGSIQGVDSQNPGNGYGGPNGQEDPSGDVDDEAGGYAAKPLAPRMIPAGADGRIGGQNYRQDPTGETDDETRDSFGADAQTLQLRGPEDRVPRATIVVPRGIEARIDATRGKDGRLAVPTEQERPLSKRSDFFGMRSSPSSRDSYGPLVDQPWKSAWDESLSTFSIDVDTASYTNLRRMIKEGRSIQPDAVRIEECINYFDYNYPEPEGDSPFRVQSVLATCPWEKDHLLARVSIKGREVANNARPPSNLVFMIDVSGSMQSPDKLPMLKRAMKVLIDELDERDRVGMVVYAGTEGVVLPPTRLDQEGKSKAIAALAKLEAGGSTNGGAGLKRAYLMAFENMQAEGVNRVIMASDGDFNVGMTGQGQLVEEVKASAAKGVSLSVLGFGTGNLNDSMMEAITNDGNGNYFYVDGDREAKRVFLDKLSGTLVTIAKDVKIQVEFNPGKVKAYRLIGYANRVLRNQDFNNDKVDAGDIGAGHTVTAFYEIVPVGVAAPGVGDVDELRYQKPEGRKELVESDDWFTLKLRYKHPEGDKSQLIETPVRGDAMAWEEAGNDFRMASAAALFGMKLRKMEDLSEVTWDQVIEIAKPTLAEDPQEQRAEFVEMLKGMK